MLPAQGSFTRLHIIVHRGGTGKRKHCEIELKSFCGGIGNFGLCMVNAEPKLIMV